MNLKKSTYHPSKRLDKINDQIFVKMFTITFLSTIQPGFISSSFRHLNKMCPQLEQLIRPVDTDSFTPWKWFRSPKVWAAVMGLPLPTNWMYGEPRAIGLKMRWFGQIHNLQRPGLKAMPQQLWRLSFLPLCSLANQCMFLIPSKNEAIENLSSSRLFYKEELASELIWYSERHVLGEESRPKIS